MTRNDLPCLLSLRKSSHRLQLLTFPLEISRTNSRYLLLYSESPDQLIRHAFVLRIPKSAPITYSCTPPTQIAYFCNANVPPDSNYSLCHFKLLTFAIQISPPTPIAYFCIAYSLARLLLLTFVMKIAQLTPISCFLFYCKCPD